jgi:hypothetical protein
MPRATIIVEVTRPEDVAACEDWFAKWTQSLTYQSENTGCGCCVNIWDVEGSDEAIAAIPSGIQGHSSWVDDGIRKS